MSFCPGPSGLSGHFGTKWCSIFTEADPIIEMLEVEMNREERRAQTERPQFQSDHPMQPHLPSHNVVIDWSGDVAGR